MAQAHPVVELIGEIALAGGQRRSAIGKRRIDRRPLDTDPRTMLVQRTAIGHEREPRSRILDRLALEQRAVEALPSLCVTRFQIARVGLDADRPQPRRGAGDDAPAELLELLAQEPIGSIATQDKRAHPRSLRILRGRRILLSG